MRHQSGLRRACLSSYEYKSNNHPLAERERDSKCTLIQEKRAFDISENSRGVTIL